MIADSRGVKPLNDCIRLIRKDECKGACLEVNEARRAGGSKLKREIWQVSCRLSLVLDDDCFSGVVTPADCPSPF